MSNCSAQKSDTLIASIFMASPSVVWRCLLAWERTYLRYSGWMVFRRLKKYSLGGAFPAGYLSGKYDT